MSLLRDVTVTAVRMTARSRGPAAGRAGWIHTVTKEGAVRSLSAEGAARELLITQARWFKASRLRGER